MSDDTFKFNREVLVAKLKSVRDYLQGFVGRPGYNAFVWAAKNLAPLEKRLNDGEETLELHNAIAQIPQEEPIAKGAEHNVSNPPKDHQAAGGSSNAGQVLVQGAGGLVPIPLTNPNVPKV